MASGSATKKKGNVVAGIIGALGALAMVVSVFLPWLRTSVEVTNGWTAAETDSKVVLAIGVAGLLLSVIHLVGARNVVLKLAVIAAGVAGIVYSVIDSLSVGDVSDSLNPAIGAGLYVLPAGALILLIGGAIAGVKR